MGHCFSAMDFFFINFFIWYTYTAVVPAERISGSLPGIDAPFASIRADKRALKSIDILHRMYSGHYAHSPLQWRDSACVRMCKPARPTCNIYYLNALFGPNGLCKQHKNGALFYYVRSFTSAIHPGGMSSAPPLTIVSWTVD